MKELTDKDYRIYLRFLLEDLISIFFVGAPYYTCKDSLKRISDAESLLDELFERLIKEGIISPTSNKNKFIVEVEPLFKATGLKLNPKKVEEKIESTNRENFQKIIEAFVKEREFTIGEVGGYTNLELIECKSVLEPLKKQGIIGPTEDNSYRYKLLFDYKDIDLDKIIRTECLEKVCVEYLQSQRKILEEKRDKPYIEARKEAKFVEYGNPQFFPWLDVVNCYENELSKMAKKKLANNEYVDIKCKCGRDVDKLRLVYFRTPEWTWKELCGREGLLFVCDNCKEQVHFDLYIMN